MKHETITLYGEELDIYYQLTEGMISSSRDVPNDEDELNIIQIEEDGEDITFEIGADEFEKIEQLLVDKILN
jgi:hypothetical protein